MTTQVAIVLALAVGMALEPHSASEEVLTRSRAMYQALKSYADTGVVIVEGQSPGAPLTSEKHTFTTYYRAPGHYLFEFKEDPNAGGDHVAIWSGGADFRSWWSATGVAEAYPAAQAISAFATMSFPTGGSALHMASWLLPKVSIQGTLTDIRNPTSGGTVDLGGRRCHRVNGEVQAHFGAARAVSIWIDVETLLVRRILEDTPRGLPAGTIDRSTTDFDPKVNLTIEDSSFEFKTPARQD